ncbi:MAG: cyclic nucleotide-binding domain-containing protein [Spirochaetota bacterium]
MYTISYPGHTISQAHTCSSAGEACLSSIDSRLEERRSREVPELLVSPEDLLRKIPLLSDLSDEPFTQLADRLRSRSFPANEQIITQGESGNRVRAVTPVLVYELRGQDAHTAMREHPQILRALEAADRERRQ